MFSKQFFLVSLVSLCVFASQCQCDGGRSVVEGAGDASMVDELGVDRIVVEKPSRKVCFICSKLGNSSRSVLNLSKFAEYRVRQNPVLSFWYRVPANAKLTLIMEAVGLKRLYTFVGNKDQVPPFVEPKPFILGLVQDDTWRVLHLDLGKMVGKDVTIATIWIQDFESGASARYKFAFSHFPSFIANFDPQVTQGDYKVERQLCK